MLMSQRQSVSTEPAATTELTQTHQDVCNFCTELAVSLRCTLKCCFTSTETVGLFGTGQARDDHLDFQVTQLLSSVSLRITHHD